MGGHGFVLLFRWAALSICAPGPITGTLDSRRALWDDGESRVLPQRGGASITRISHRVSDPNPGSDHPIIIKEHHHGLAR
ncbi:hypothetical protein GCM10009807_11320 [Microbacterium lacus]|uniref:Secreted protein n=1 Tax=Microbacterium lacus TaxID=415217 RepID=A0ABN2GC81_9MICO